MAALDGKIATHDAPPAMVPLLFFAGAVAGLLLALGLGAWQAEVLAGPWQHMPYTLAVLHLYVLGWGTTLIMGALYQMAPVVVHGRLHSGALGIGQLGLHALGVGLLVTGFWRWESSLIITGGTAVVAGMCLWAYNLARTLRSGRMPNWAGAGMWGTLAYVLAVAGWGLTMALNVRYGFIQRFDGPLAAHAALGAGGWFTLTIALVSFKLVPMFAVSPPIPRRPGAAVLLGLGLPPLGIALALALVPGARWLPPALAAGWSVAALGYTWLLWRSLAARRGGRTLEPPVRFAAAAAAVLGALTAAAWVPGAVAAPERQAALAYAFLTGWVGTMALGQLYRILPFVVWLDRFRRRAQPTEPVPFLHVMAPRERAPWILALWLAGTATATAGLAVAAAQVLRVGMLLQMAAALLFARTAVRAALHLRRPATAAPRARPGHPQAGGGPGAAGI